jgi:uncharacterized protein (TIGR02598 family)
MNPTWSPGSRDRSTGFSLTEVALALAIISFAFVAILGVIPAGLDASRNAVNHTVVAGILAQVQQRLLQQPLQPGAVAFSPLFFSDNGTPIPADAETNALSSRVYRADVEIVEWARRPENTGTLSPLRVSLSWPVDGRGEAVGRLNPKTTAVYTVSSLTGPDWEQIDRQYRSKIEF